MFIRLQSLMMMETLDNVDGLQDLFEPFVS